MSLEDIIVIKYGRTKELKGDKLLKKKKNDKFSLTEKHVFRDIIFE